MRATSQLAERVNDLLLPIVKGVGSERAYEQLAQSLQTLGGSGFLQDYPIEQYIRDSKIDTPVRGHHGDPVAGLLLPQDHPGQGPGAGACGRRDHRVPGGRGRQRPAQGGAGAARQALEDVQGMLGAMVGYLTTVAGGPAQRLQGRPEHRAAADERRRPAGRLAAAAPGGVALAALDGTPSAKDRAFYQGKVAVAGFFANTVLPELSARRKVVETTDNSLMDVDEAAF